MFHINNYKIFSQALELHAPVMRYLSAALAAALAGQSLGFFGEDASQLGASHFLCGLLATSVIASPVLERRFLASAHPASQPILAPHAFEVLGGWLTALMRSQRVLAAGVLCSLGVYAATTPQALSLAQWLGAGLSAWCFFGHYLAKKVEQAVDQRIAEMEANGTDFDF